MKYALTNVKIITGRLEDEIITGKNIVIDDGKILSIDDDLSKLVGVKIIDLEGMYLLPGLINLHVHLPGSGMPKDTKKQTKESVNKLMSNVLTKYIVYKLCEGYAKTELYSGVTTIRTVGGLNDIDSKIRDNVKLGKTLAPRILTSNMAISVPNGHMAGVLAYKAESVEDAVKYVDKIALTKPDLIKLMITGGVLDAEKVGEPGVLRMRPELVKAAVDEAHKLGYKVASHVESSEGVRVALENGVDTIEHGASIGDHEIELFKKNNSAHVLTISPVIPLYMFDLSVSKGNEMTRANAKIVFDGMVDCAKKCLENNVLVGLGTDTACPFVTHYDMYRELIYFTKYVGVSNKFALHTATAVNAKIAGILDETGTVEVGKMADFMVVENNPIDDLKNLSTPKMVIFNGKLINNPKVKKYDYVEEELNKYI